MYSMGLYQAYAVVHIRDYAQIDAVNPRLIQHILHNGALAGRGKEDLIDKLLAGVLE